jgi:capsular polysaccharide transport system permease protein
MKLASFTPRRLQIWMLAVPIGLSLLYFLIFAAPRYVSESMVSVRLATVAPTVTPGMISMTGAPTPLSYEDTIYLMEYVQSRTMLDAIDVKLKLRSHYEKPVWDFIGRLWPNTSTEWFLWYWQQRVLVSFDDQSGLLTIDAQAFDPQMALKLQRTILQLSEQWVNDYSWRIAREQIDFAQKLTDSANKRLQDTKLAVVEFQTKYHLLDPTSQSAAASSLTASLQATLASQQSTLAGLLAYMNADTGQIQTLRGQIAATQAQLNTERMRATVGSDSDRLSTLNVQYTNLLLDETLALNNYSAAAAALDAARVDAQRKLKSLAVVEDATTPDSATYPRYIYDMITIIVVCLLVYTVVRLTIATILEHRD